jgi:hypothetical protein
MTLWMYLTQSLGWIAALSIAGLIVRPVLAEQASSDLTERET